MIIVYAAIALATLSHVIAIEPRVGHGGRVGVTAIAASGTSHTSIGLVVLGPPPEEDSTAESSKSNHTNHNSGRDSSSVMAGGGLLLLT